MEKKTSFQFKLNTKISTTTQRNDFNDYPISLMIYTFTKIQ